MKNPIKVLLLGAVVIGMAAGCDKKTSSSVSDISSAPASVESSNTTTASSSATPSSNSSVNTSSAVSSSSVASSITPTIVDFEVIDTNVKKEYTEGEQLNLANLVVNTVYSDGKKVAVTNYTVAPANETTLYKLGENTITVSYESFTAKTFKVTVNSAWDNATQTAMKSALYGEVIPFIDGTPATNAIRFDAGEYEKGKFEAYVNRLTANGYALLTDNDGSYIYEKTVQTSAGERIVTIAITTNGNMTVSAMDRYIYEFPSEAFTAEAKNAFGSNNAIPAIEAHHYLLTGETSIICFYSSTLADGGYTEILKQANWKTFDKGENDEYYHATSPDGIYEVQYLYVAELNCLSIIFTYLSYWNNESLTAFFNKYEEEAFDVPAFNKEGVQYLFLDNSANAAYFENDQKELIKCAYFVLGAKETDIPAYVNVLKEAGWKTSYVDGVCTAKLIIPEKGVAKLTVAYQLTFDAVTVIIDLMLDPLPNTTFPTAEIEETLGVGYIDYVPELTGQDCSFEFVSNQYGDFVFVYTDDGKEDDVMGAYITILGQSGYKEAGEDLEGNMRYISANDELLITLIKMGNGLFIISFEEAPLLEFPSEDFEDVYGTEGTLIPEVTGAVYYTSQTIGKYVRVEAIYKTAEKANEVLTAYKQALVTATFTFSKTDDNGDDHYVSPNGTIDVKVYATDNVFVIYASEVIPNTWPTDRVASFLSEYEISDTVPAYNNGTAYKVLYYSRTETLSIEVSVEDEEAAYYEYLAILKEAKYTTEDDEDELDIYLYSENDEIEINLWTDDYKHTLIIDICSNL